MRITLEFTPEEENRLRSEADAEGKDVTTYIRQRVFATAPNLPPLDDLAFLQGASATAIFAAQQKLIAQGIGYVYQRNDGRIVRHLPDGGEELLTSVKADDRSG